MKLFQQPDAFQQRGAAHAQLVENRFAALELFENVVQLLLQFLNAFLARLFFVVELVGKLRRRFLFRRAFIQFRLSVFQTLLVAAPMFRLGFQLTLQRRNLVCQRGYRSRLFESRVAILFVLRFDFVRLLLQLKLFRLSVRAQRRQLFLLL